MNSSAHEGDGDGASDGDSDEDDGDGDDMTASILHPSITIRLRRPPENFRYLVRSFVRSFVRRDVDANFFSKTRKVSKK